MYSPISDWQRLEIDGSSFFYESWIFLGADVNRTTYNNDASVLSLACAGGHFEIATILLIHGANPNHLLKVDLCLDLIRRGVIRSSSS